MPSEVPWYITWVKNFVNLSRFDICGYKILSILPSAAIFPSVANLFVEFNFENLLKIRNLQNLLPTPIRF